MALQILKNAALLPDLDRNDYPYATVQVRPVNVLQRLLGIGIGSVSVTPDCDSSRPVIRVTPPVWKQGEQDEWEILTQCYTQVLRLAQQYQCNTIVIPLLTTQDPSFPAYIDYKIAVDTIRSFLNGTDMDVFLLATRQAAFQMPELRTDVEQFLARNFFDTLPGWSSAPFAAGDARFATIAPGVMDMDMDFCPSPAQEKFPTGSLPSAQELENLLRATDAGFSDTLLDLIDRTGKKDSEIYSKANISRQHFSKIRNNPNYKPTKPTAIAFAIALELDMEQTRDLIGRAGYALTNSSKFDVIIMYFIQRRNYNMFEINETLYEFDQSLLGA